MSRFSTVLLLLLICSLSINVYLYFVITISTTVPATALPELTKPTSTLKPVEVVTKTVEDNQNDITAARANQFFDQLQFEQAVVVYEALVRVDEQAANGVKRRWHDRLKAQLKANEYPTIDAFLAAFLQSDPYDLTFLALKADMLAATGQIVESITVYFSLISNTFDTRQEEYYQARIHHLATEQLATFKKSLSWQAVVEFAEQMTQLESDYPPYLLAQAEALINLGEYDIAEQLLEPMLEISFYREQAQALLSLIHKTKLQQTAIKLQPYGEHYIVDGQINESSNIQLMIDTGASISVLTRVMFDEIESWTSPLYKGDTLLNTAGGQVNAPIYQFERFQIGDFYVDNISFVVLDIDNMQSYHGLLGMNFLKQFKFQIDQENNLLILSP